MTTLANYLKTNPTVSPPPKQNILQKIAGFGNKLGAKIADPVLNAFNSGIDTSAQGVNDAANAKNPGQFISAIGKTGSGIATSLSSPLAPIMNPISQGVVNPIADKISNNPVVQNFANSPAGQNTAKLAETVGNFANIVGTAAGGEDLYHSLTPENSGLHPIFSRSTPIMNPGDLPLNSPASEVLKNPVSADEMAQAADQGRAQMVKGKSQVLPSKSDLAMQKAIQPLIDDGRISVNKEIGTGLIKGDTQLQNIASTNDEITKIGNDTKSALQDSKAIWNGNELKGVANSVEIPDPVKNEGTLSKNAASLRKAISTIGDDLPKTADGTQQVLQKFDQYVKQNYGSNFFDKGRNFDPFHGYVYSLRDSLNEWGASKLPEGNLPSGESYRDARLRQSNLINAKDEMKAKFAREYPEGMSRFDRTMKAHPALRMGTRILARQLLRVPITVGEEAAGVNALEKAIRK